MNQFSYLQPVSSAYIEGLFEEYSKDSSSVDSSWRAFFDALALSEQGGSSFDAKVADLISGYRERGRLYSDINPLEAPLKEHDLLRLEHFGLSQNDLNKKTHAGVLLGLNNASLSEVIAKLESIYCQTIAAEFAHILTPSERGFFIEEFEKKFQNIELSTEKKTKIYQRLSESEAFEKFIHTRYVGQKRFSIEGAESLIPALDQVFETLVEYGAEQAVIGMAHRGRLNVLRNTFKKDAKYILTEFEGQYDIKNRTSEGDVKYHMGHSTDLNVHGKNFHISMAFNPSHLEFVNPVVEGMVRGKQRILKDKNRDKVIPILIHGDAAFAGQGVVYETLNFSQVPGMTTGGTIHIVINNQVGFTTDPEHSRSTPYCTDLAKMLEAPVFHVNGDDVEAVVKAIELLTRYRMIYKKDCVLDLVCYRKFGHNEGDEPQFTQPYFVGLIKNHPTPREVYLKKLVQNGVLSQNQCEEIYNIAMDEMSASQKQVKDENTPLFDSSYEGLWSEYKKAKPEDIYKRIETRVHKNELNQLSEIIFKKQENAHPKLQKLYEERLNLVREAKAIDWGTAENLAYATLLKEGHSVRLSGQDVQRGTFSHRQCVVHDQVTFEKRIPLNEISENQGEFLVFNSTLSETGVLGFEYGWSLVDPNSLVIWEAQFGDFANGAQVIIDQFIASGEAKWNRASGLTLFLPHGFEGQGPEHSSGRIERFLQLCANKNMTVLNLTEPSQIFHAIRRQVKRNFRKPLVVFTPKSLLRHPKAVSSMAAFTERSFFEILDDTSIGMRSKNQVRKILLCSGKIYYDLLKKREDLNLKDVAIVRIEQLYPLNRKALEKVLSFYPKSAPIYYVQEEPRNQGAWSFLMEKWYMGENSLQKKCGYRGLGYIGRSASPSVAVGSIKVHQLEVESILNQAFK